MNKFINLKYLGLLILIVGCSGVGLYLVYFKQNSNTIVSNNKPTPQVTSVITITPKQLDAISLDFTTEQKSTAEKLISLFENGTTKIKYDYAEDLNDGRGITSGRAGFTTADGDAYIVVKRYTEMVPNNPLAKYLEELKKLAEEGDDTTDNLDGYESAWKKASENIVFRQVQDSVVDELYFEPTLKHVNELGLHFPLSVAVIYDSIIQHGNEDDKDSLPSLIKRTNSKMGGSPKSNVDEQAWILEFLKFRRQTLENASNEESRDVWAESVGRCDVFTQLVESQNYQLTLPIKIKTSEYDTTIK